MEVPETKARKRHPIEIELRFHLLPSPPLPFVPSITRRSPQLRPTEGFPRDTRADIDIDPRPILLRRITFLPAITPVTGTTVLLRRRTILTTRTLVDMPIRTPTPASHLLHMHLIFLPAITVGLLLTPVGLLPTTHTITTLPTFDGSIRRIHAVPIPFLFLSLARPRIAPTIRRVRIPARATIRDTDPRVCRSLTTVSGNFHGPPLLRRETALPLRRKRFLRSPFATTTAAEPKPNARALPPLVPFRRLVPRTRPLPTDAETRRLRELRRPRDRPSNETPSSARAPRPTAGPNASIPPSNAR
mmetsp:Transcript_20722/g.43564  ORF Transcript_20722/g.43564 Transcript_20722/m.43564 type:complete len:302 (-) Transcript_20722:1357-2262(-)